jgi:hypothetical protein
VSESRNNTQLYATTQARFGDGVLLNMRVASA